MRTRTRNTRWLAVYLSVLAIAAAGSAPLLAAPSEAFGAASSGMLFTAEPLEIENVSAWAAPAWAHTDVAQGASRPADPGSPGPAAVDQPAAGTIINKTHNSDHTRTRAGSTPSSSAGTAPRPNPSAPGMTRDAASPAAPAAGAASSAARPASGVDGPATRAAGPEPSKASTAPADKSP